MSYFISHFYTSMKDKSINYLVYMSYLQSKCSYSQRLKGTVHSKIKNIYFSSDVCDIFRYKLFWCELSSFGDICLFSNIMGLNGALNVVLTAMSLSRNHDPVT